MLPLITVLTVVRDHDVAAIRRAAIQVRYVALAAGGFDRVQWLIAVDDLSLTPEAVRAVLSDVTVRHEVWVNCTGQHGNGAARDFIAPFASGQYLFLLDGDAGDDVNTDDVVHEILAMDHGYANRPDEPPTT